MFIIHYTNGLFNEYIGEHSDNSITAHNYGSKYKIQNL